MAYAIGSVSGGGVRYSDGTIKYPGSSATNSNYANYKPTNQTSVNQPYVPKPAGSVSGDTSGGSPTQPTQAPTVSGQENQDWYTNEFGNRVAITDADRERGQREAALRGQIDSGFNSLKQGYNDLLPYYEQEGNRRVGQVADTYKTIFSGIDEAKQGGMDKLALARSGVAQRSANSVQDLKANLGQVMRNTGMQLGAMGAGDTSASQVMAPYAYTKLAGKEFGGIARQANEQYGTIDQKNVDLEQQYGQMYNQTEIEKSQQIEAIRSDVGSQIARIREMIPQVDAQRAQALAGLEQSLLSQAQQQLMQLQAEDRQKKDNLQQWALQRVAQLQDAQLSISQTANYNPSEIMYNELKSVGAMPAYGQDQEAYFNPQMLAQKRRQELGLA